jgi:ribonucleotide monophosphatase NagD (HAD superfamily)
MDGAALVAMHRNRFWRTSGGWQLDGGAYVAALEAAAGVEAAVCGKPAAAAFIAALEQIDVAPSRAVMLGDDVENDIVGAQAAGLAGALVRTGKFRESDLAAGDPDVVLGSIAELPSLLTG